MNPLANMPGFEVMQAQQKAFFAAMTGGWKPGDEPAAEAKPQPAAEDESAAEELDAIKKQLADMQAILSKMNKT